LYLENSSAGLFIFYEHFSKKVFFGVKEVFFVPKEVNLVIKVGGL